MKSHLHPFTAVSESVPPAYVIERADGVMIYDQDGKDYLDAMSGLWCVNAGYGNQNIIQALTQASTNASFAHTLFGASNKYVERLAEKLIELSPGNCMRKVFFGHSGSDANDTNLKLARLYFLVSGQPQRRNFISIHDAYHGTTFAAANLSGMVGHHRNFDLPESSYLHVTAPNTFEALNKKGFKSEEDYADWLVAELEDVIVRTGPETVAAFAAEPIMATGGILIPPRTYFPKVKKLLDRHGILLLIDDVVCAFGRTGHWFGWETIGVEPDLVTIAKGLTSGYVPMSASIIGQRVWSTFKKHQHEIGVLGHGFTMSGHPVAAAAALANIEVLEKGSLLAASTVRGAYLLNALRDALSDLPCVIDIRGSALLIGVELAPAEGDESRILSPSNVAISKLCLQHGLVVRASACRNVIALAPPLIISESDAMKIVEILSKSLREALAAPSLVPTA